MYIILLSMSAALFLTGAFLAGKAYLAYSKGEEVDYELFFCKSTASFVYRAREGADYELFFLRSVIGCVLMASSFIIANTSAAFHMLGVGFG